MSEAKGFWKLRPPTPKTGDTAKQEHTLLTSNLATLQWPAHPEGCELNIQAYHAPLTCSQLGIDSLLYESTVIQMDIFSNSGPHVHYEIFHSDLSFDKLPV